MVIIVRFEVTDEQRGAVRRGKGQTGLATRAEIESLAQFVLEQELDEQVAAYPAPRRGAESQASMDSPPIANFESQLRARIDELEAALGALVDWANRVGGYTSPGDQDVLRRARRALAR